MNYDVEPRLTSDEERKIMLAEITALAVTGEYIAGYIGQLLNSMYFPKPIASVSDAMAYAYGHPLVLAGARLMVDKSPKGFDLLVRLPSPGHLTPWGRHCAFLNAHEVIDELLLNWVLGRYGFPKFPAL